MRIGRIDHDGRRPHGGDRWRRASGFWIGCYRCSTLLGVDPTERERLAARVEAELPLARGALLAPVEPPTIRDFSVFEQHIEGVIKDANPDATVPPVWYESPFCYFTNPHAADRPRRGDPSAARLPAARPRARGRGGDRPHRAGISPPARQARTSPATRSSTTGRRATCRSPRCSSDSGCARARTSRTRSGPGSSRPTSSSAIRDGDRLDLELRAEINGTPLGTDTLANMAWSFPELVSYASRGTWVRPGDVLGSGTCGNGCLLELWGRRGRDAHRAARARRCRLAPRRGDRDVDATQWSPAPRHMLLPPARTGRRAPRSAAA